MKRLLIFGVSIVLTAVFVSAIWAFWSNEKILNGTVKDIEKNILTIVQMTTDGQQAKEVAVEVNQQTEFKQLSSLENLKGGDQVEIKYEVDGNKNIAVSISKIESTTELEAPSKAL